VESIEKTNEVIKTLLLEGRIDRNLWTEDLVLTPGELGLTLHDGAYIWPDRPDLLNDAEIARSTDLTKLKVFHAVDSTSTVLLARANQRSVDRWLYTAECQVRGRGRRGRVWSSPFARNLALSYGHASKYTMAELGGLSLLTGLAVAEAIHRMGAPDVKVKWPNDLVVNERKLCGILIDLTQTAGKTNVVVGIGINVDLTRADKGKIDRSVIDLRELGLKQSRTEILIQIVGSLQTMLRRFEDEGFQSFIETFNHHHAYQDQSCTVHMGDRIIEGVVRGVAIDGALVMETDRGYEHFRGGEVSLRKY